MSCLFNIDRLKRIILLDGDIEQLELRNNISSGRDRLPRDEGNETGLGHSFRSVPEATPLENGATLFPNLTDSKKKRNPLFGLHVHPDCSRLATGGIGRSFSTLPLSDVD
jgi:hypothetical protein